AVDQIPYGMTATWVARASNRPFMLSASISHQNFTHDLIVAGRSFGVNILAAGAQDLALVFGRQSGREVDKFENLNFRLSAHGNPILSEHTVAFLDCRVETSVQAGDHTLFLTEVLDGCVLTDEQPLVFHRRDFV
ncbi:MAG: flavin reductase family protein, partial [Proteobacteria bacterium]|nr:flavin reductase family protein [Pseudomonadota bacterium]